MIADTIVLNEIRNSWSGVRTIRARVQRQMAAAIFPGGSAAFLLSEIAHNLLFVHACAVLNDALEQLRDENHFHCKSRFLGDLVDKSKAALPWQNHSTICTIVDKRNGIAHRGEIVARAECFMYVDAIEAELVHLGIITAT